MATEPIDEDLRCLTCGRFTSRLEADSRVTHPGHCAACGGGELIPMPDYYVILRIEELRFDAAAAWGRFRAAAYAASIRSQGVRRPWGIR